MVLTGRVVLERHVQVMEIGKPFLIGTRACDSLSQEKGRVQHGHLYSKTR